MYRILPILTMPRKSPNAGKIAASAPFVDGRITNPHNKTKQNEQLHEPQAYQKSSQLLPQAFVRERGVPGLRFPGEDRAAVDDPLPARNAIRRPCGRRLHPAARRRRIRSDSAARSSSTSPSEYDGGALHMQLGDAELASNCSPGEAIVYPSDTLHEVSR